MDKTQVNQSRETRKEFFAFRNGIIADKLRRAGDPHAIIMGCLLSDLMAIAQRTRETVGDEVALAALATELWSDTHSRECRLVAPMLFPPQLMDKHLALQWCNSVESIEVADNLCHKLLRHTACASEVCTSLIGEDCFLVKYTGYRLLLNLLLLGKTQPSAQIKAAVISDAQHAQPVLASLLRDIQEELAETK